MNNDTRSFESLDPDAMLTAYAFDELDDDDAQQVEARLENDADLRAQLEAIRALGSDLEAAFQAEPADVLTEKERSAIAEGATPTFLFPRSSVSRRLAVGLVGLAASIIIVGGVAFPLLSRSNDAVSINEPPVNVGSTFDVNAGIAIGGADELNLNPTASPSPPAPPVGERRASGEATFGAPPSAVSERGTLDAGQIMTMSDVAIIGDGRAREETSPMGLDHRSSDEIGDSMRSVAGRRSRFEPMNEVAVSDSVAPGVAGGIRRYQQPIESIAPPAHRYADEAPRGETYVGSEPNAFKLASEEPLSTFSIDVDSASYSNIRRLLNDGQRPPAAAVRIEEMINAFDYEYAPPASAADDPFAVHVEVNDAPWTHGHRLVRIGLKGYEIDIEERPRANLVFLIDVSGSMKSENKLPLVKRSLTRLVEALRPDDRIAIVTYASSSGIALPSTPCAQRSTIISMIDRLHAGGSTAGADGIQTAYTVARQHFVEDGINRVILATDGDFNVGISDDAELERFISTKRDSGIYLSVLSFGTGNLQDGKMERLSNAGNGNYAYIDSIDEANRVLVRNLSATLMTIAKDVKIQIDFNPAQVRAYRLIGYENRALRDEDFANDRVDAGEIGAGHTVTALYEIIPAGSDATIPGSVEPSEFVDAEPTTTDDLVNDVDGQDDRMLVVRLRYKRPDSDTSVLRKYPVVDDGRQLAEASGDFRFASAVAAFGMMLRESPYRGESSFTLVRELAGAGTSHASELKRLVENFAHYIATNQPTLARSFGEALLDDSITPESLASIVGHDRLRGRLFRAIETARQDETLVEIANAVDARVRGGFRPEAPGVPTDAIDIVDEREAFIDLVNQAEQVLSVSP